MTSIQTHLPEKQGKEANVVVMKTIRSGSWLNKVPLNRERIAH